MSEKKITAVGKILRAMLGTVRIEYTPPQWARGSKDPAARAARAAKAEAAKAVKAAKAEAAKAAKDAKAEAANAAKAGSGAAQDAGSGPGPSSRKVLAALSAFLGRLKPFVDLSGKKSFWTYGLLAVLAIIVFIVVRAAGMANALTYSFSGPAPDPKGGPSLAPVSLVFSGSAARIDLVGKDLDSGVSLSPETKGRWAWSTDAQLVFFPAEAWPVGASFRVRIDKSILSSRVRLRDDSASFAIDPMSVNLASSAFYVDPVVPGNKRVTATVSFSHLPDRAEFENCVDFGGPFTVAWDPDGLRAYITSSPIGVPDKAFERSIRIQGKITPAAGGSPAVVDLSAKVTVPGRYDKSGIDGVEASAVRQPSFEYLQILDFALGFGISPAALAKGITVDLLPKDRPESPGTPRDENHRWELKEIDAGVLSRSERLSLTALPIERDYAERVQLSYDAPSGRHLLIRQQSELEFMGGYRARSGFKEIVTVPEIPRQVSIMHDGSILSMSGERKISLFANDIDDVLFEIGRIVPDEVNHLVSQTEGDFKNPQFQYWNFRLEDLSSIFEERLHLQRKEAGRPQYFSFDFDKYLGRQPDPRMKYGLFSFKVSEYDAAKKRVGNASSRRFILVTDLGILVKRGERSGYDLFVQSVRSGLPVEGARVDVIGRNGLSVLNEVTDAGGHVHFPRLDGFGREKAPVAFVVKRGEDMSFLPVSGQDRFLNYSRFDVGGTYGADDPGFVDAYLFSDRGVYRPGEDVHIGMIVKSGSWSKSLAGLPLELGVQDPRGLEIRRQRLALPDSGFAEFSWSTIASSAVGKYEVSLYIARDKEERKLIGSTSVKVEEFKPDRLAIRSRFVGDQGLAWMAPSDLKAEVGLANLYGMPASGNVIRASVSLAPAALRLSKWRDYRFFDPFQAQKTFVEPLGEKAADKEGKAVFAVDLSRFDKATFFVRLQAEGLEKEGGRSVAAESAVIVSPLASIVGCKADGDLAYINKGSSRTISFIAVDRAQRAVDIKGLELRVEESRYVSILEKGADNLYHYRSVEKRIPVSAAKADLRGASGLDFALPTSSPGDFRVILADGSGTKLQDIGYTVIGAANLARSLDKNAELQVRLDRPDYSNGDLIMVNVKAPYVGAGLITIERDKVYAYKWFRADTSASVQSIKVPEGLEGTAYVNVSFVRDIGSREIYASPLSYGVAPFSISRERRTDRIVLDAPEEARGGTRLTIGYTSARPSKAVVFAVDMGILQVAKYRTPAPLDHFFQKRALEVGTSQILDLILPEYSVVKAVSAMGGDEEGPESNLNPFKRKNKPPVAYWSGIVDSGPERRTVSFELPPWYNGTVKIMAVAVADDSIGAAERETVVRNDFIITPNVPPVLAPGDEFELGVNVASDLRGSAGKADVAISLSVPKDRLAVMGESKAKLGLARGEEGTVYFKLKALDALGEARIDLSAEGGGASSSLWESVSVRPFLPYRVALASGRIAGGKKELPIDRTLLPEFKRANVSVSYLPIGIAGGLKDYLDSYPYGCTEQILSRAFPFLALAGRKEFGVDAKSAGEAFASAQRVLRARQNAAGGFGLWAAADDAPLFVTAYGAHYLTDAKEAGMDVDLPLLDGALRALKTALEADPGLKSNDPRAAAYAIYVLTRNGVVTTSYVNSLRGSDYLPRDWRSGPAASYLSGAYALMKQDGEAQSLLGSALAGSGSASGYFYGRLAVRSLCLYMAARHIPSRLAAAADAAVVDIVDAVGASNFNTLSASYAILGLAAYAGTADPGSATAVEVAFKKAGGEYAAQAVSRGLVGRTDIPAGAASVRISETSGRQLYYQVKQAGFDAAGPKQPEDHGIEIFREYTDSSGKPVTSVEIGSSVDVRVRLRAIGAKAAPIDDVAIVDMFPSGFELDGAPGREAGMATSFVEPREDRMLVFCRATSDVQEFTYRLKATSAGSFVQPVVFAEAMYDLSIWSMRPSAGTLTVANRAR